MHPSSHSPAPRAPRAAVPALLLVSFGAALAVAACATAGVGDAPDLPFGADAGDAAHAADAKHTADAAKDATPAPDAPSGDETGTADDAGGDTGTDPGTDAGIDTGIDAGFDAGIDTGIDSGPGTVDKPKQGEVLVTEVMYDPSTTEPNTEWIEMYNTQATARLLSGLELQDGSGRTHTIASSPQVVVGPHAYVVLARLASDVETTAKVPAASVVYEYGAGQTSSSGIILTNSSTGAITLLDGATVIAQAPYASWYGTPNGKSIQLKTLSFAAESDKASWCLSANPWTSGSDDGTPGAASDCP